MGKNRDRKQKQGTGDVNADFVHRLKSDMCHDIVYYLSASGTAPARDFIATSPPKVRAHIIAVAIAVAQAPPKRFAGGGYWEAMHGTMTGWFEIRSDGPGKSIHYRVFCLLDSVAAGTTKPLLVLVNGLKKSKGSVFSEKEYRGIRALGDDYFAQNPRRL